MQEENGKSGVGWDHDKMLINGRSLESWSIIDRFEYIAEHFSLRVAVADHDDRWTYRQLNERANQIAHALLDAGITREEPVGIAVEKSCALIAAVLGVLKAGGAYVPLVNNQPIARLRSMIGDAQCRLVISSDGYLDELWDADASSACTSVAVDSCDAFPVENPDQGRTSDQLAYILFTSGSTGTPKGVMIEDAGVIRLVCDQRYLPFGPDFHYLFAAPMSFDVSTLEIFTPLLHGAKLVIVPEGDLDPYAIQELCRREGVVSTCMAFGLFASLFESCPGIFEQMPIVAVGGEQVIPETIAQAQRRFPNTRFINAYGPTEATMLATTHPIGDLVSEPMDALPIGKPLDRMSVCVLDDQLLAVPQGEIGELCIGGVGIARGYLNQAELTADRFVERATAQGHTHRIYRTGDLVYQDENDDLVFVGRKDTQVKVHGYRIELGEIESVALKIDGVRNAVALVIGGEGAQTIALGVVGDPRGALGGVRWKEELGRHLPGYMVPEVVHVFDSFPLNRNGKVDRESLGGELQMIWEGTQAPRQQVPLLTQTERWLGETIGELLGVSRVYSNDQFLHLGGHSLRAVVLCSRIRDQYCVMIPMSRVYQLKTIGAIADWIDSQVAQGSIEQGESGICVVDQGGKSLLSFNQQRLWMLNQLNPDDVSYAISLRFEFDGQVDQESFEQAWSLMCSRHQVLHSRIKVIDGVPYQVIDDQIKLDIQWINSDGVDADQLSDRIGRDAAVVFDIEHGPLARCAVYTQGCESHILVTMHHIISDAWSCDVIQRELSIAYQALVQGGEPKLPDLPIQYADFAHWQRGLVQTAQYRKDLAYWKKQLEDFESVELPLDYTRSSMSNGSGSRVDRVLDAEVCARIHDASNELGVTSYAYMLGVFQAWIHRLTGCEDVLVGTPIANREWTQVEELIGFFMETAAIRTQVRHTDSIADVIRRVSATSLDAFDHRDVPFQHIVEAVHAHAGHGRNPLFEVFFNQITMDLVAGGERGPIRFADRQGQGHTAKFDLTCYIIQKADTIEVVFNYRDELFDACTIERFIDQYIRLIQGAVSNPKAAVSAIDVYTPREQALSDSNDQLARCASTQRVDAYVKQIVEQYPDHSAVIWGTGSLSYAQLWERSGQGASVLWENGIEEGDRVMICSDHPGEMASAILGAIRIGAVYIPIDSSWPDGRIAQIARSVSPVYAFTDSAMAQRLQGLGLGDELVLVDREAARSSSRRGEGKYTEGGQIDPSAPAYILFTSGSTGEPKGVVQSHHGVVSHMQAFANSIDLGPTDRILQLSSWAFDSAIMDMFSAWFRGAALCVCDIQRLDQSRVGSFIMDHEITIYHSAPSVFRWLMSPGAQASDWPTIRAVVLGGEPVGIGDVGDLSKRFPGCELFVNGMGLTESSLTLQLRAHPDQLKAYTRWVPVGFPVEGSSVRLVDRDGMPTQLTGEIEVASDRIALGYWDQDTKSIIPIGASIDGQSGRRFRTGDRGMMLSDGSIRHCGRIDRQVQVHGCRVELDEVETAIKSIGGVADAAVLAEQFEGGDHELWGYVVLDESNHAHQLLDDQTIRTELAGKLPGYMVPTLWRRVAHIPRVGGGKTHRLALVDCQTIPFSRRDGQDDRAGREVSEMTQTVIRAFEGVLGEDRVCPDDCLFKLGGNSLKAIRVFAILRKETGTKLGISTIYQASTPRQLAELIEHELASGDSGQEHESSFVTLAPPPSGRSVFLIPGIGGQPMGFMPLVELLKSSRGFIGVQLPSVEMLEQVGDTLEDLASWMIGQMDIEHTLRAPDIVGYSFGGALAFEIALQLQEQGMEPGRLVLLDAHLPSGLPKKGRLGTLGTHVANVAQGPSSGRVHYIRSKVLGKPGIDPNREGHETIGHQEIRSFKRNARANRKMLVSYIPAQQYRGEACLLQAIQPGWLGFHRDDHLNGWSRVLEINKVQTRQVHFEHMELFQAPAVEEVAQIVGSWLDTG